MVLEAQWETPYRIGREAVTRYLSSGAWDGTPILASMGALGHYMQESSKAGFNIADFLHEGNGDLWTAALARPERYVNWILSRNARRVGACSRNARAAIRRFWLASIASPRVGAWHSIASDRRGPGVWPGPPCAIGDQKCTSNEKFSWVFPRSILSPRKPFASPPVLPTPNTCLTSRPSP